MHNKKHQAYSLSQNDYPIPRIKRFVSFTQHTHNKYVASCTTSVYVNLSKNSFSTHPEHRGFRKRVQRYALFPKQQNFFGKNFMFYAKIFLLVTNIKAKYRVHLIIYNIEE